MGIRIPDLLEGILEATAAEAAAKARIASYRAALEDEARRRLEADGAAPTWKAADLGAVRYETAGAWAATVADPAAFGSYVAEHYPTEATAVLRLPADQLEAALEALGFAGVEAVTDVEVAPTWAKGYLEGLAVDASYRDDGSLDATVADTDTGAVVPGLTATRSAPKLVVTLDRNRRTAAVEEARTATAEAITAAAGDDAPGPDLAELDQRRRDLEGLTVEVLNIIAKGHGLSGSGTKPALAERIARAELATGRVIRPATQLEEPDLAEATHYPAEQHPTAEGLAIMGNRLVGHRIPYVGEGADGARRSAQIDREEADGLDRTDPRYDEVLASAARWDAQADELEAAARPACHMAGLPADEHDAICAVAEGLEGLGSRELLRKVAKAKGLPASGTKAELARRLAEAGITAADAETLAS